MLKAFINTLIDNWGAINLLMTIAALAGFFIDPSGVHPFEKLCKEDTFFVIFTMMVFNVLVDDFNWK